jgi:cell volume regulation protein A
MTWLMQLGMFLILGLLVKPHELLEVAPMALLVGLFLIFIGRPASVMLCLLPFKEMSFRAKIFVSWVGLKGAAPIIFATYPILAGIPGSDQIFNVVFFITMLSLVIQGMSITYAAKLLKLDLPPEEKPETFGIEIPEEAGTLLDYEVTSDDLSNGTTLKEIPLPEGTRVVMIQREGKLIVPDGTVTLQEGDILVLIKG